METEFCDCYLGIVCLKLGQDAILGEDSGNRGYDLGNRGLAPIDVSDLPRRKEHGDSQDPQEGWSLICSRDESQYLELKAECLKTSQDIVSNARLDSSP
jgi:hypothetical protein